MNNKYNFKYIIYSYKRNIYYCVLVISILYNNYMYRLNKYKVPRLIEKMEVVVVNNKTNKISYVLEKIN